MLANESRTDVSLFADAHERHSSKNSISEEYRIVGDAPSKCDEWLHACNSMVWHETLRRAIRYANASDPVAIVGEYGTGKVQLAYRMAGHRQTSQIIHIACERLTSRLVEFGCNGWKRITTSLYGKSGNPNAVWLFEGIDELQLNHQPLILELIRQLRRSNNDGVAVISTSKTPLVEMLESRRIREDLYYAVSVHELVVPPLRERPNDIGSLSRYFASSLAKADHPIQFTNDACALLAEHHWPGNAIELRNLVSQVAVLSNRRHIDREQLLSAWKLPRRKASPIDSLNLEDAETQLILKAVARSAGNKTAAAKQLGITTRTLHNKMQKYKRLGIIDDQESTYEPDVK